MSVFASWVRDATLSFLNTLRRWKSTVAGLTKQLPGDVAVAVPLADQPGDLRFLRSQHVGGTGDLLADMFTGRIQLDRGPVRRIRRHPWRPACRRRCAAEPARRGGDAGGAATPRTPGEFGRGRS